LSSNAIGLKFEIDPPDTSTGRDTVTEIKRKDITGCSFSFTTEEDDWKYLKDGSVERTIVKVGELFDIGPVTYPAYPDTTVAARSMEKVLAEHTTISSAEEEPENREEPTEEEIKAERARERDIDIKYKKAGRILNRINSKLSKD
jgi:phage head maturation protease